MFQKFIMSYFSFISLLYNTPLCQVPVAHTCNPSLLGGSCFEASSGKEFTRPYLKNIQLITVLAEWLKW
jgi:hypothetical protein